MNLAKTVFAERLFSETSPTTIFCHHGGCLFGLLLRFEPAAVSFTLGISVKNAASAKKIFFAPDFKAGGTSSEKSLLKYQEFLIFQKFCLSFLDADQSFRSQP